MTMRGSHALRNCAIRFVAGLNVGTAWAHICWAKERMGEWAKWKTRGEGASPRNLKAPPYLMAGT